MQSRCNCFRFPISTIQKKLSLLFLHILDDIETNDCAVVFKEIWAIAERNSLVKKAVDEYYKKVYAMLYQALKERAPKNCKEQQINNAVAILLPFIEGYCITSPNLNVSTKKLSEQLGLILYNLLN